MPLDPLISELVDRLLAGAGLPGGFRRHLWAQHVDAIEASVGRGAVPSIGIGPALSASFVSSELLILLLRECFPEWRTPLCLPEILVIEGLRPNYQVVHYGELFSELAARAGPSLSSPPTISFLRMEIPRFCGHPR
jgi:hypothetical protein